MHRSLIQRALIVALSSFVAWSTATTAQAQQIQTVFVISMENHNLTQPNPLSSPQQIKGNVAAPYLNSLMTPNNPNAVQTSFATNYQNVGAGIHPSAPNYIWSQGGSNFGVLNDNDPFGTNGSAQTTAQNLSNYLQAGGITWKAYEEDTDINVTNNTVLPSNQWTVPLTSASGTFVSGTNAYNGSNQYNYDVNHDPMVYFTDTDGGNDSTTGNPFAHNYAPLQQLQTDLANGTVAQYNWITPDLYNTAHNPLPGGFTYNGTHYTGDQAAVAQGDYFLSVIVPMIQASQAYKNNGVIIIWFDETEGGDTSAYTIPEIILSPLAKGNAYSDNTLYTHSSDLVTTEEIFGVGPCIRGACSAYDLATLFQPGAIGLGPTLASISPSTGVQGSAVPVTLTGTAFAAPLTINVSGTGITVSNVSVVSSTQATATFNIAANAGVGQQNVSVTTGGRTSGNVSFSVTSTVGAPTLTSVTPNSGTQGTAVNVTLAGTNFIAGATVGATGSGITVSNVVVVSGTQITATLTLAANATLGPSNISVTTSAGVSNTIPFTVNAAAPTLTSVTPNSGTRGTAVNVTLAGTNFIAGATVGATGSGITVSNVVVVSSTQITATLTLAANATLGASSISVTTSAGVSNTVPFTVNAAVPTLTSVTPNSGTQGTAVNVTLAGTNFIAGATVGVTGSGITVSNVAVVSGTQITATLTIAASATPGAYSISVTTTGGTSNTVAFTVNAANGLPTLTSITPSSGARGTSVNVTLTGTNFTSASQVRLVGGGLTQTNIIVVSSTQITATYNISSSVATGPHNTWVVTSAGSSNILTFTVTAAQNAPTLTSVTPNGGTRGTAVNVTLAGTNFISGATVGVTGSGITVSNVVVVSGTQITATLTLAANATLGASNISVTTSAGVSNTIPFTVNAAAPTLTSVTPNSGTQGTAVNVTLAGTNFIAGATVGATGSGITVSNVVVVSGTQITATLTLAANATLGPSNISVTTSAGVSNTIPFTVNAAAPTLTSVTPNSGTRGTAVNVTLAGTNFIAGATVGATGSGITVSNVVVVSGTQITATLTLAANATLGASSISVTTSAGVSNTVPFTVNAAVPTLTSVTPNSGTQGTAVNVTLAGTNFIAGATVGVTGSGITVSNVAVVSGTQITATLTLAASATSGASSISVTTTGGTSNTVAFTVNAANGLPTLTSITPSSGARGTSVNVTLTGTNFTSASQVRLQGLGLTQTNIVVVSSTQITATYNISSSVATGPHNTWVVTSAGSSNILTFTVN